ncbi:MAG: cytochrome c3 family protein [Coriobacteriales bacterium]|jgi:hypothetical protein|nr:cytochrome c3 family protein [Coriobacteriales bacterium]
MNPENEENEEPEESDLTTDDVETDVFESGEPHSSPKSSGQRKNHRKLWVTLGIIAVALVGLSTGAWVWHEDPTFCNAFCHKPMDSYVEGYVSDDPVLLVSAHKDAGLECLDCHESNMAQQVEELGKWVSGDFQDPLAMTKAGTREFCSQSGCHDDLEAIKGQTVGYNGSARNPHDSHYEDLLECYSCHRVHRESTLYCNQCHPDITPPQTWAAAGQ